MKDKQQRDIDALFEELDSIAALVVGLEKGTGNIVVRTRYDISGPVDSSGIAVIDAPASFQLVYILTGFATQILDVSPVSIQDQASGATMLEILGAKKPTSTSPNRRRSSVGKGNGKGSKQYGADAEESEPTSDEPTNRRSTDITVH